MHNRTVRSFILALLIAVGIAAVYLLWNSHQQSLAAADRSRALNTALDAILADLAELGAAQHAYVVPGQSDASWMTRASLLLQGLYDKASALQAVDAGAEPTARTMRESLDALVAIDAHAREYLRMHHDLMASDLVFNDARESLAAIAADVASLRAAGAAEGRESLRGQGTLQASAIGAAAVVWLAGIVLLMRAPNAVAAVPVPASQTAPALEVPTVQAEPVAASPVGASIDWARAAEASGDLARLSDASALPSLLSRIGQALDAHGVILWLGAGEQLFAAAAHGYESRVLSRLGPIDRGASNAAAAAWRSETMQTVAGDAVVNGAIVAPLVSPTGCRGVLAVEVRAGGEADPAARAGIAMIAAQLGGLVTAWPAGSAADTPPISQAV